MSPSPLDEWQGSTVAEWRAAWGVPIVEAYASIGSTSDRALELAAGSGNAFAVVIADEQTAGRGRRGADWHSPAGAGLWMSTVLPWSRPAPHVTLLVGLAVAEAIEEASGRVRIGLKWPNDLVVGRRKMGGVLCESTGTAVVAGIGINLRPGVAIERATSLEAESGNTLSSSVLAGFIVAALRRRAAPDAALDAVVLGQLSARDALLGTPVDTDEHGRGTARGIDADGALLLERPDGSRVRVMAGSVRPL